MTAENLGELLPCPFCGKEVEALENGPYAPLIHHPPYDRRCPLTDKVYLRAAWNTRASPVTEREALEEALAGALGTLEAHPGYAGDVSFGAIWQWLAKKTAAEDKARAALALSPVGNEGEATDG